MPEGTDATTTRTSRCANHPGEAGIAACELCGRWLCVACAVPVRGRVIGPECLASVVEDALTERGVRVERAPLTPAVLRGLRRS